MITKEIAKEIGSKFIGELIISNAYSITEEPKSNWNIYNCPTNCFYICIPNIIDSRGYLLLTSSLLIAIDKSNGSIKYFGTTNDEG